MIGLTRPLLSDPDEAASRHYRPITGFDRRAVKEGFERGASDEAIGDALGRSPLAVAGIRQSLGLFRNRPQPGRVSRLELAFIDLLARVEALEGGKP
jgi:hypothetical protein